MAQSEGRAQGLGVAIGVGLAFALAAVVMFALFHLLRGQGPSARTPVGITFAFGWAMATLAAAVPLMLRLGTLRAGMIRTGPGATSEGGAMIETRSRAPAIFIALSAVLLLVAMLMLYGDGSTTPLGALVGAGLAVCMFSWARHAWPPKAPFDPASPPPGRS